MILLPSEVTYRKLGRSPDSRVFLYHPSQIAPVDLALSPYTVAGAVMGFHHFPY